MSSSKTIPDGTFEKNQSSAWITPEATPRLLGDVLMNISTFEFNLNSETTPRILVILSLSVGFRGPSTET
jgi:hypothetical protein